MPLHPAKAIHLNTGILWYRQCQGVTVNIKTKTFCEGFTRVKYLLKFTALAESVTLHVTKWLPAGNNTENRPCIQRLLTFPLHVKKLTSCAPQTAKHTSSAL